MSPGILRERMHLFVAQDLTAGEQALEPGELITTRVVPWAEAVAMCLDGRIHDAKSVAGILLAVEARRRAATGQLTDIPAWPPARGDLSPRPPGSRAT